MACGLCTDIPGFGLRIQEKSVIGSNHDIVETRFFELMNCHPDPLQRVVDQAQRRFRVTLELAFIFQYLSVEPISVEKVLVSVAVGSRTAPLASLSRKERRDDGCSISLPPRSPLDKDVL